MVINDVVLNDVKIKPIINSDSTQLGLIIFPAVQSFVTVGQVDDNNTDIVIISSTVIESIALDTDTALNLLVTADGKINLNMVALTLNNGKNGGIPLLNPLVNIILKLQQQVNTLITTFNAHVHAVAGAATSPTATPGPPVTAPLIKTTDIANKVIMQ